jgi:polyisoprenyl-phosphate glycosyltransferase
MLSVVIPALDEELAIGKVVAEIRDALDAASIPHEIIVVDDGSSDATGRLARAAGATVLRHPAPGGYGRALKDGIFAAHHDIVAIIDADGTYPAASLPLLHALVAEHGFDMAVGARTGSHYRGTFFKMPARRVFLWLSEYATGVRIPDINSGLRVFRRELALRYIHTISNGFSFTTTITLAALLNGFFVTYLPIDYLPRIGRSHVRHYRDSLRGLQIIVENILYYNPLKLFLLLCQMLGVLACAGALLFAFGPGRLEVLGAVMTAFSVVGALLVAAIGFLATQAGLEHRAGSSGDAHRAAAILERNRRGGPVNHGDTAATRPSPSTDGPPLLEDPPGG